LASAAFFVAYEIVNKWLTLGIMSKVAKGDTPEMKEFYASKACFNSYKMQYFIFATIWGYLVLEPSGWLNWEIGGTLTIPEQTKLLLPTMPFKAVPRGMQMYALVTMGFHAGDWFAMAFIREVTNDYYEMTLHHISTITCYFVTVTTNITLGFVGFYLHDIADIFTTMGRMVSATKFEGASIAVAVCLLSSWIWTRLWILPQYMYAVWTTPVHESMYYLQWFNAIQTLVLQFLHIYWFYLIAGMVVHKLKTGKTEDTMGRKVSTKIK